MSVQYVVDEQRKRVGVFLPVEEYERMVEEIEELEDTRLYDEAKAALESGEDELIPFEQVMRELKEGRVQEQRFSSSLTAEMSTARKSAACDASKTPSTA